MALKGADIHATDKNGVTALHHAVRFRSPLAVKTLIEHGANVNQACRRNGSTPLHRAVTQTGAPGTAGKAAAAEEIIRILLEAGADPSIANKAGKKRQTMWRTKPSSRGFRRNECAVVQERNSKLTPRWGVGFGRSTPSMVQLPHDHRTVPCDAAPAAVPSLYDSYG